MVIPGVTDSLVVSTAIGFCERRMVFLIVDPSITDSADGSKPALPGLVSNPLIQDTVAAQVRSKNAALYFPYLQSSDPFTGAATNLVTGQSFEIPPAPTVAGIFAATDVARGVWKAPAGFQAVTNNTTGVTVRGRMTDPRQGTLNPISVNCLRDFPNVGTIVFGSRTLASTFDQQWTYVPVRRMALFLEQTFLANLKWVIFEPNAEPLWTAITMSLNAFMLGLFKKGAFQGTKPSEAFRVQCDSQTTTQTDIDSGVVNIIVSFAPLKPAEFVVITIAQLAGQTQTS
jgi:phage tail sheath protein FI